MPAKLLPFISKAAVAAPPELLIPLKVPAAVPVKVKPVRLLLLKLINEVTAPELEINSLIPAKVAAVELPLKVLLVILKLAEAAELKMPINTPDVAEAYVQPVIKLFAIVIELLAAVLPDAFSMAVKFDVVAPDLTVTVLLLIVALALVALFV